LACEKKKKKKAKKGKGKNKIKDSGLEEKKIFEAEKSRHDRSRYTLILFQKGEETSSRNGKKVFVSQNPLEKYAHYDSSA